MSTLESTAFSGARKGRPLSLMARLHDTTFNPTFHLSTNLEPDRRSIGSQRSLCVKSSKTHDALADTFLDSRKQPVALVLVGRRLESFSRSPPFRASRPVSLPARVHVIKRTFGDETCELVSPGERSRVSDLLSRVSPVVRTHSDCETRRARCTPVR